MSYLIGLDVGTTAVKAVVCDAKGKVYAKALREYPLVTKAGGIVEQSAHDWYDASIEVLQKVAGQVDASMIEGIGLSTQGASMLAVDEQFNPLCEVITWMDQRATEECEYLKQTVGEEEIYRMCGWRAAPDCDAAKILWIKRKRPEIFAKAASFVSTVEYINYKLTGVNSIDLSNAAIRQLINISTKQWDERVLKAIGIDKSRLPQIQASGTEVGGITPQIAALTGLRPGLKVYQGAHDQYCAALGSGSVSPGDMLVATGTTWVMLGITDKLMYTESKAAPGIHPAEGMYGVMRSISCGGSSLKWLAGVIGEHDYANIDKEAERRIEKAANVYCRPYFTGGRHGSLAAFTGLGLDSDAYDMALAVMEGVVFEARRAMDELQRSGLKSSEVTMTGGAAKSELWTALTAYITGCQISVPEEKDTCCIGAAMLAAVGSGIYADYKTAAANMVAKRRLSHNNDSLKEHYRVKYSCYLSNKII